MRTWNVENVSHSIVPAVHCGCLCFQCLNHSCVHVLTNLANCALVLVGRGGLGVGLLQSLSCRLLGEGKATRTKGVAGRAKGGRGERGEVSSQSPLPPVLLKYLGRDGPARGQATTLVRDLRARFTARFTHQLRAAGRGTHGNVKVPQQGSLLRNDLHTGVGVDGDSPAAHCGSRRVGMSKKGGRDHSHRPAPQAVRAARRRCTRRRSPAPEWHTQRPSARQTWPRMRRTAGGESRQGCAASGTRTKVRLRASRVKHLNDTGLETSEGGDVVRHDTKVPRGGGHIDLVHLSLVVKGLHSRRGKAANR